MLWNCQEAVQITAANFHFQDLQVSSLLKQPVETASECHGTGTQARLKHQLKLCPCLGRHRPREWDP